MITSLAKDQHEKRVRALKNDIRIAVAVHEAGHAVLGQLHGLRGPILLPSIRIRQDIPEISENAAIAFRVNGLSQAAITDLCFGGYCGELAFYDEKILRSGVPIWVNADRAANDLIAFVRRTQIKEDSPGTYERRLSAGGDQASDTVRELFVEYGKGTYDKMLTLRNQLIMTAQEIYDFWKAKRFERSDWLRDRAT